MSRRRARWRRTIWSIVTATMITAPVTNVLHVAWMPKKMIPLWIEAMISVPISAPITVPEPPVSGVPPMITAAITVKMKSPPVCGSIEAK